MLVLSRKNGQSIRIGRSIEVTVLEIKGGKVKLGFAAPPEMAIQRNDIRNAYPKALEPWRPSSILGELCTV
jgi:carbon storage regulator